MALSCLSPQTAMHWQFLCALLGLMNASQVCGRGKLKLIYLYILSDKNTWKPGNKWKTHRCLMRIRVRGTRTFIPGIPLFTGTFIAWIPWFPPSHHWSSSICAKCGNADTYMKENRKSIYSFWNYRSTLCYQPRHYVSTALNTQRSLIFCALNSNFNLNVTVSTVTPSYNINL